MTVSHLFFSYANRAKNIKNQPRINEDPKDALLRKFQDEIARLKERLDGKGSRKSRRRKNRDGTDNDDMDEESRPEDEELYLQQQQDKLNEEKRLILQRKNLNGK